MHHDISVLVPPFILNLCYFANISIYFLNYWHYTIYGGPTWCINGFSLVFYCIGSAFCIQGKKKRVQFCWCNLNKSL